ncbi:hypothetical protein H6768_03895 [Candidatus Peribacteria bacterium]|nr:hypothetical protein [Candidatus Peribacteria bacterium]
MLSLQFIRENPDIVRAAIKNKSTNIDFDAFLVLDTKKKKLQFEVETLRTRRNELSQQIQKRSILEEVIKDDKIAKNELSGNEYSAEEKRIVMINEAKSLKETLQNLEKEYEEIETEHSALLKKIPNIPTDDTPIGHTEEENVVVREWGKIPEFSFKPRDHAEIAALHGWIDKERAANVAGSRFAYLMGDLVMLQFALIQFVMNTLTSEETL